MRTPSERGEVDAVADPAPSGNRLELLKRSFRSIQGEMALGTEIDAKLYKDIEDGIAELTLAARRRQDDPKE